ncbi:MAG: T9SS type A sorting domain-containing protein [Ignavibacteriales bacterium]|nr:T9SS type A sorting domain-containing protein [Ignavibacteriales bacterium]
MQRAGYHEVIFDGSGLTSGVYFYRIQANNYLETKKLLLMK